MNKEKAYRALKATAKQNGVSLETVMKEIEIAIAAGMANTDPEVQAFWRTVPCKGAVPTPVELVACLSEMAGQQKKTSRSFPLMQGIPS